MSSLFTKTLYNELAAGALPLSLLEMPEILKRKRRKVSSHAHKRLKGRSIDDRPDIVDARIEFGHWETDTVVGRRSGKEAAILTLVERVTNNYLAIRIPGKNSKAVIDAMESLRAENGHYFFPGMPTRWSPDFCEKIGITRYTFHCLRYTHASHLLLAEEGLSHVARRLGHSDISVTYKYYFNFIPEEERESLKELEERLKKKK